MNFQTMNKQRKFILIAAAIGIISVFLPWATISAGLMGYSESESTNGFHGVGIMVFLAFAVSGILTLVGDQTKAFEQSLWLVALGAGAAALLFTIIAFMQAGGDMSGGLGIVEASHGFGIWMALLAAAGIIVSAWIFKSPSSDLKSSLENLKKSVSTTGTPSQKPQQETTASVNKINELERLIKLKEDGNITEEEYDRLKSKLI